jgi:hypothetical protein
MDKKEEIKSEIIKLEKRLSILRWELRRIELDEYDDNRVYRTEERSRDARLDCCIVRGKASLSKSNQLLNYKTNNNETTNIFSCHSDLLRRTLELQQQHRWRQDRNS